MTVAWLAVLIHPIRTSEVAELRAARDAARAEVARLRGEVWRLLDEQQNWPYQRGLRDGMERGRRRGWRQALAGGEALNDAFAGLNRSLAAETDRIAGMPTQHPGDRR